MEDQEIKLCPFCKSSDVSVDRIDIGRDSEEYYVICTDCVMTGPDAVSERIAIKMWNELPR